MSKVVRVQDFLIAKDPDKYKKMFEGKAENEKEELAKQEAVVTLPNENRELLKEVQRLENEINDLAREKVKLVKANEKLEGYVKDLKKIIDEKEDSPPDDQGGEGDEKEDKKEDKKKSKRELERERT